MKRKHVPSLLIHLGKNPFPFSCGTTFHLCCSVMAALAWPLCQVIFWETCVTPPFLGLIVFCAWSLQTPFLGSAELKQPTGSLMLQNMVLPPNSSYSQMCDMASPLAWALVLAEPFHALIQLSTTKENVWGPFGRWAVKLGYFFTGLVGWTGSAGCPLSTRIREKTKAFGRERGEQNEWGGRGGSKLIHQLYHQTVPEYPLCKHIPYCCWRQVPG